MKLKAIVASLILSVILLSGCSSSNNKIQAESFFKGYLNLDQLPNGISDFKGKSEDRFPVFLSRGYFQYKADPSYFDLLVTHDKFFEINETNQKIHQVECTEIPQDLFALTNENIDTEGKLCYMGIFVPYIHYIIYDPNTKSVNHFIEGIRG